MQNENESVKTNAINYIQTLKKCLEELMGYLSRACLGDMKLRASLSNFYFEYKCFVENINSLLNVYAESVTEQFDQISISKFNLNLNDKMVTAKLKKSKRLDKDETVLKELNQAVKNCAEENNEKQELNFANYMHVLKKMNPFFNDFNNFEELGRFRDLIDCLLDAEKLQTERDTNKKSGDDLEEQQFKELIADINDKENQYSTEVMMKLKVDSLIEFYSNQYEIDKENLSKNSNRAFCSSCKKSQVKSAANEKVESSNNLDSNNASPYKAKDQSKMLLKDLLEDLEDSEINATRLSSNILDIKMREKTFKNKVETMKAETKKLLVDLSNAKENLERHQVKVLLQEKKQSDIKMKIRFYEEKTHKFKHDTLKKAALLIELEKKKLTLSKQYQRDSVFDDELNKKLSVSMPPYKGSV